MGTTTIPMASQVYIGLAVTSHNPALTANATFSNITTTGTSPAPSLTSLTPTSGAVGTALTIVGANFGTTQGSSTVTVNGTPTTPISWTDTSLTTPVPAGATTGPVVVTVGGQASNGVTFTVTSTTGLPVPWTAQDIGGPAVAGSTTYSAGTFSVTGAGVDIWNTSDQFQFVYQTLNGDGQIVALVDSLQNTNPWAKAGVMIRQDLTGGAANVMAAVTAGNGMTFQQRVTEGGASTYNNAGFSGVAPYWVQLVRSGNTFTGYYSASGTGWILMGTTTIPMASQVYIGLAVTSHNPALTANATFSNVTITAP
jgi:regulation of enolase protein 1 (concanavalin A-like superfamily)